MLLLLLAAGRWSLAAGRWLLAAGCWLLAVDGTGGGDTRLRIAEAPPVCRQPHKTRPQKAMLQK
jgi:hypothetical protein